MGSAVVELWEILDEEPVVPFVWGAREEENNSTLILKEFMERLA